MASLSACGPQGATQADEPPDCFKHPEADRRWWETQNAGVQVRGGAEQQLIYPVAQFPHAVRPLRQTGQCGRPKSVPQGRTRAERPQACRCSSQAQELERARIKREKRKQSKQQKLQQQPAAKDAEEASDFVGQVSGRVSSSPEL